MNKYVCLLNACILILTSCTGSAIKQTQKDRLTDYVNPFIGTATHGHTYPGAAYPFGQIQLSPDNGTQGWDWCSGYNYSDGKLSGFSHLHLSGTGLGDPESGLRCMGK
jgi:putative alpha-1,2-mannosidase